MKILLVDDSTSISMVIEQMLKDANIETIVASNGKEALDRYKEDHHFDVILLDWEMPIMNGMEFLSALFDYDSFAPPVIMMTSENRRERIIQALESGASEYVMKPFTAEIIISKINQVTQRVA